MSFNTFRTIHISVLVYGKEFVLDTYPNEYPNLMMLIYDKIYLENFGDCKGIGRCGTCHVRILTASTKLPDQQRNERTTLGKMEITHSNSRLACQILIDTTIDGMLVEIQSENDLGLY